MSRGFVKEDDQEETPFIPPRAALPNGVPNYVTVKGMKELQLEKSTLEKERKDLTAENDKERRLALAVINGRLDLLEERILSAQLIRVEDQPKDEVRFGAAVETIVNSGKQEGLKRKFTIVGVDEASVRDNKIAFIAPIVRCLLGKRVGEQAQFKMGDSLQELTIISIDYNKMG